MRGTVGCSKPKPRGCSWKFLVTKGVHLEVPRGAARGFSLASRGVQLEAFGGPEISWSWTSKLKFSGILRIIAIVTSIRYVNMSCNYRSADLYYKATFYEM